MAAIVVVLALAGAATALAVARDPGVTAPAPERIARSAVHSVTNAPEADATGGAPWSAHRVSPDSTSTLSETGVPETGVPSKAAAPPDSPTAPSLVQTGPVGADAVLETVNSPALPEGHGLQVNAAARAATGGAGRNGAGPPAQAAPVTSFDITLSPGANLISLPLIPGDIGIEAVLAGILDRVETVWQYDTSGAVPRWRSYAPGAPSDLGVMRDGLGYWVLLKDGGAGDTVLTVTGREETGPARRVARGWNLVGYTSTSPQSPGEYLGALGGSAGTTMVGYAGGAAAAVLPSAAPPQLMPGRGYWLYVEAAGTIGGAPPETMAALVALYNATGGANWGNNRNWLSNAPIGAWHGVTTDSDGRVTHLFLYSNQLTGEIPAELGSLTNLEVLALFDNQLTGEIPAELGNLANLEWLQLDDNQLTGEIPAELGNLANLQTLFLYNNQLTGEIPAELGNLTNLEVLALFNNQLTGEIPAELGNLANLQTLSLDYNQLTGSIPAELGSLTNLTELELRSNQLTGEIPAELGDLTNLEALLLSGNQLTGCIPASLGDVAIIYPAELGLSYCSGDQAPDLVASVTSVGDAGILYVGESFTINAEVYNQGTGPAASANLSYYRSTDRTIPTSSDTLIGTDVVDPVPVSETRAESISRTAPSRTGTYHYGVCVDPVAGESDILNNCSQAFPATVLERTSPDLVAFVTSVGDAGILYVGESFTINAEVYNQGTGPAASANLSYYRSTDRTISTSSDTLIGTDVVDPVPVSETRAESISRTAPSRTGTYHYGVCVDPVAGESNTRNNCSGAFTAMVLERTSPDLVAFVTSVGDAGILYVGESFTINAEVYNQGTGPAASANLSYYRSTDSIISTSSDTLIGTDVVDPVPVSGTRVESISRTAPSRTGTYYYYVCVDPVAGESDILNNCSQAYPVDVDEPGKPDLIVQSPSASDNNPDTGGPLILYATVQNVGDGRLESARLTYYLSDNDTISGTDSAIRTVDVLDIYASSSIQMVLYGQNAPQDGGTYYYGACVHSAVPSESNTRNNCSDAYPVVVDEPGNPDLVAFVTAAGDAAVMYVDEPSATISALVGNEGDGTSSSTRLRFYLSSDSSITPTDDTLVGEIIVRAIGAGSSRDYSISMTAPSSEGTYYYYVCVDSVPGESDTQDNCQENAHKVLVLKPVWYYSDAECRRTFSLFPLGYNYWFEGTIHARTALSSVIVRGWVGGYPEGLSYIDDDGGDLGSMTAGEDKDFSVTGFLAFTYQTQCGIHIFWEY